MSSNNYGYFLHRIMYDILGDKHLLKSANSILVVCNKQGELVITVL